MTRSLVCFLFVITLHAAIICMLHLGDNVVGMSQPALRYLQYVAIIPPTFPPASPPQTSAHKIKKSDLKTNSAASSESVMSSVIEPATDVQSIQPDVLPKLDLETLQTNAARYELDRERSPIELAQERNRRNQSLKARLEKSANEARRTDCRTSYTQTGLLAPLFITADLLREKGCKF